MFREHIVIITRKTLKSRLSRIVRHKNYCDLIKRFVNQANNIIFCCSSFIRAFVIHKYENKEPLPELTRDFIQTCFRVLTKKKKNGPKQKRGLDTLKQLNEFYENSFIKLLYPNRNINKDNINQYKFDSSNLSYILNATADEMRISYENNIRLNFFRYICQFVNQSFKEEHSKLIDKCTKGKTVLRKQLRSELRQVKNDLIYDTLTSPVKYHSWITKQKGKILPSQYKRSYESDLKHYPFKYMRYMITMNRFLEDKGLKMFQPIPVRTEVKDKYVTINTNALIDILPLDNKTEFFKNVKDEKKLSELLIGKGKMFKQVTQIQHDLWDLLFNLSNLKLKNYSFNYQIQTDGFATSVNFIHKDEILRKRLRFERMKAASVRSKQIRKSRTQEEVQKLIEDKKEKEIQKLVDSKKRFLEKKKQEKKQKKKVSKQERLQKKLEKNEFNYIGDLIKCEDILKKLKAKKQKLVYVDPGKRSPLFLLGENGQKYEYRTRRRLRETKRLKYGRLIDNKKGTTITDIKNGQTIKEVEAELSSMKKKSTYQKEMNKYIKLKFKLRNFVSKSHSYNSYLQKLKWFSYINKRRHEDQLLNDLERTYKKDAIMVVGDWGGKGRLSYISTPNVGLKRLLSKRFSVYLIDEFRTSMLHNKTEEKCNKLSLKINGKQRELHSVLTYQMGNGRQGCINRDLNAAMNMRKIVGSLLKKQKRPENYCRSSQTKTH